MSSFKMNAALLGVALLLMPGCSQSKPVPQGSSSKASTPDAAYLLAEKPDNVQGVGEARKSEDAAEDVVVEGRIGGSRKPFVDGMAAFTIVDPAIPHCGDEEGCPTPWDYCCETAKLKGNTALVKIVGPDGTPVSKDARELLGVKELSKVVVQGKAKRDEQGNLTVLAEKVHIAKE